MTRIILGIIVGFVAWTILWLGSDYIFGMLLPWYQAQNDALELAVVNQKALPADNTQLLIRLATSVIASILSGFLSVVVSKEQAKTTIILGILLLIVGIAVQASIWSYIPIWYHLTFLVLLIPMTILGGKLNRSTL